MEAKNRINKTALYFQPLSVYLWYGTCSLAWQQTQDPIFTRQEYFRTRLVDATAILLEIPESGWLSPPGCIEFTEIGNQVQHPDAAEAI